MRGYAVEHNIRNFISSRDIFGTDRIQIKPHSLYIVLLDCTLKEMRALYLSAILTIWIIMVLLHIIQ